MVVSTLRLQCVKRLRIHSTGCWTLFLCLPPPEGGDGVLLIPVFRVLPSGAVAGCVPVLRCFVRLCAIVCVFVLWALVGKISTTIVDIWYRARYVQSVQV